MPSDKACITAMKTMSRYKTISADCRYGRQSDPKDAVITAVLGGPRSAAYRVEGFAP